MKDNLKSSMISYTYDIIYDFIGICLVYEVGCMVVIVEEI